MYFLSYVLYNVEIQLLDKLCQLLLLILLIHLRIVLVYLLPLYSLVRLIYLSSILHFLNLLCKILVFFSPVIVTPNAIYTAFFTTIPSCFTLKYVASTNTIAYCYSNCLFCHSLISGMILSVIAVTISGLTFTP